MSEYAVYLGLNSDKKHEARLEGGNVVVFTIPWDKFSVVKDLKVNCLISIVFNNGVWNLIGV